jgi:hypothetical protein
MLIHAKKYLEVDLLHNRMQIEFQQLRALQTLQDYVLLHMCKKSEALK